MLYAVPKRWFAWDFWLLEPTGALAAEVLVSSWRERGALVVGGSEYRIHRQGLLGAFILEGPDGSQAAVAEKPSAFRREFLVRRGEHHYVLKAVSVFGRKYGLYHDHTQIGTIAPASWFGRRAMVDLGDDLPPALQGFIVWLTLILWKRASDSSGSDGAGS